MIEPPCERSTGMVTLVPPPAPVIRALPLRLVPPPPAEKVERHIVEREAVALVSRALNTWAYSVDG